MREIWTGTERRHPVAGRGRDVSTHEGRQQTREGRSGMALTSRRHQQCLFCDLRLLASGTWRQYIPVVYKSPHWRALLWLPWTLYCGVEGQLLPLRPQVLFPRPLPWVGPSCPQPRALPFPPTPSLPGAGCPLPPVSSSNQGNLPNSTWCLTPLYLPLSPQLLHSLRPLSLQRAPSPTSQASLGP